ncbi:hypothetical protein GCM10027067_19020 [Pseudactinotalea suaedae]
MMTMPHLLLIAMYFPPSRASGVYRALALANYLAAHGWRVTVITVDEAYFDEVTGSADPGLLERIHPEVRVRRVRMPRGHLQSDLRNVGWWRANFPKPAAHIDGLVGKVFPDKYTRWIPGVVADALRVHRRERIDLVLSTGNPWSSFEAARLMHRATRIPYVLDYRDSWTLSQFTESDAFPPGHPARAAEASVMAGAAAAVFVNEPMRQWHAERYPDVADRMLVLENGYDPDLFDAPPFRRPDPAQPLRFGSVGTITEVWPHTEAWQGWEDARSAPELEGATFDLYGHLGFFPQAVPIIRKLLPGPGSGVVWRGAISKTDLRRVYAEMDVVVIAIPSSRYVTAGKVYEAMATGKPIVAIHTPETAASDPLRGYPLWFPVTELSIEAAAEAYVAAARAARTVTADDHAAALVHAERYRRANLLEPFELELRRLTHG